MFSLFETVLINSYEAPSALLKRGAYKIVCQNVKLPTANTILESIGLQGFRWEEVQYSLPSGFQWCNFVKATCETRARVFASFLDPDPKWRCRLICVREGDSKYI
jgi:hypothetical protein